MSSAEIIEIIQGVERMCSEFVSNQQRIEDFKVSENFKQNVFNFTHLMELCDSNQHSNVRMFGLQCLEYTMKQKWTKLPVPEKGQIKGFIFERASSDFFTKGDYNECCILRSALSKLVVFLIKCEWPQNWPDMVNELLSLTDLGVPQKKFVLTTFLRLSQDVVHFQDVPPQRKRDIISGLTDHMPTIVTFILRTIIDHIEASSNTPGNSQQLGRGTREAHLAVVKEALETMIGFVDWVRMDLLCEGSNLSPSGENGGVATPSPIVQATSGLLRLVSHLLLIEEVRLEAAELLLVALCRKVKSEERDCLLHDTIEDPTTMARLSTAVKQLFTDTNSLFVYEERCYAFTHRLAEIVGKLGNQIVEAWETRYTTTPPASLPVFIDALVCFTQHPVRMICFQVYETWTAIFKTQNDVLIAHFKPYIPVLCKSWRVCLPKTGSPSENSALGLFHRNLFEEEEYATYIGKFRSELLKCLNAFTIACPSEGFDFILNWLSDCVNITISTTDLDTTGVCRLNSRPSVEWDAVSVSAECVMSTLTAVKQASLSTESPSTSLMIRFPSGQAALTAMLQHPLQDPVLMLHLLSNIAVLFPFAEDSPQLVIHILEKLMGILYFDLPGQDVVTRLRCVRDLRLHASTCLIRMARDNPNLIMSVFDQLFESIVSLWLNDQVSLLEKCVLLEVVVMLSDKLDNFERQRQLLEQALRPVIQLVESEDFQAAINDPPASFVAYIGLSEPNDGGLLGNNNFHINRANVTTFIMGLHSAVKRFRLPSDNTLLRQGGFIHNVNGEDRIRHPLAVIILPLVPVIFKLMKAFNSMWSPEVTALRHPDNKAAFQLSEATKLALLSRCQKSSNSTQKTSVDRLRNFLSDGHEHMMHLLGSSCQLLGHDLYGAGDISNPVLSFLFAGFDHLTDLKVSTLLKNFLRPYMCNCPPECLNTAIMPVVEQVLVSVFQRLKLRWETVTLTNEEDYDGQLTDEVIEEQIVRLLTRTAMDSVRHLLTCNGRSPALGSTETTAMDPGVGEQPAISDDVRDDVEMQQASCAGGGGAGREAKIGCLMSGVLLRGEGLWLLGGLCDAVTWPDSVSSVKAVNFVIQIVQLLSDNSSPQMTADVTSHLLMCVLKGLHVNGNDRELNLTFLLNLGVLVYERYRPVHSQLVDVLVQTTGQPVAIITSMDSKLFSPANNKPLADRAKREAFRKVVAPIVGVALSERFKENIKIRNLPPLMKSSCRQPHKALQDASESSENDTLSGLTALFAKR